MENFLDLCRRRCSVRGFSEQRISETDLDYIMECVRWAPSAVNLQPWRFLRVSDDEGCNLLRQCYTNPWFAQAHDYLIVCCDHRISWHRKSDGKDYGDVDIAIAVEHLCLAAAERGVASCWVCNFDAALCKRLFRLPDSVEPLVLLPLGYPSADHQPRPRVRMAPEELWLKRD